MYSKEILHYWFKKLSVQRETNLDASSLKFSGKPSNIFRKLAVISITEIVAFLKLWNVIYSFNFKSTWNSNYKINSVSLIKEGM